jgi:hypothetical protein
MPQKSKATQEFVPIREVRNGVITLKDGGMRAILMVSSMNFALKSEDEQKAIIFQFQNFLNTIDFTVQISVQSRKLDIRPYLAVLEERYTVQQNELLKIQIREYIDFIKILTSEPNNIMTKTFYVVVPYDPPSINVGGGFASSLPFGGKKNAEKDKQNFEENRSQLEQRVAVVESGLRTCGLRTTLLGTEEAVELFYKMFNPGDTEKPITLT